MDNKLTNKPHDKDKAVLEIIDNNTNEETDNKRFLCEPCLFERTELDATSFCVDCSEHLCPNCARDHRKAKLLRNHHLLEGEDISKEIRTFKAIRRMMRCPDHPETMVSYKCEDHERYICIMCLADCHRKCDDVNEISGAKSSGIKNTCDSVKETLSRQEIIITASKKASEERIATLKGELDRVKSEQQCYFSSLFEQLTQAKQKTELETDVITKKILNGYEQNLHKCKEALSKEQEYQTLLEYTLKFGNPREIFLSLFQFQ